MSLIDHPTFLPTVLRIDAVTCIATGLVMTAGAVHVSGLTQLPVPLLTVAGASLFPIAAFIAVVAARLPEWRAGVWLVVIGNAGWVLASLGLLAARLIEPNALGYAFVMAQAVTVAVLAALEYLGLQRQLRIG